MYRVYVMNVMPLLDEAVREEALNYTDKDRRSRVAAAKSPLAKAQSAGAGLLLAYGLSRLRQCESGGAFDDSAALGSFAVLGGFAASGSFESDGSAAPFWEEVQVVEALKRVKSCSYAWKEGEQVQRVSGGKPCFSHSSLFFNLSHSGEYAACVLADREVGIDLQREQGSKAAWRIAPRVLHEAEAAYRREEPMIYRIWTVKEAYVKATGEGIRRDFRELCVDFEKETVQRQPFQLCEPIPGYLLAVCTLAEDFF